MTNEQCELGNHNFGALTCEFCGMSKRTLELPVELASLFYESHTQVTEIAFRVFGGRSHFQRRDAAHDALERYTDYLYASESTVVSVDSYECEQRATYLLFTFNNMPNNNT